MRRHQLGVGRQVGGVGPVGAGARLVRPSPVRPPVHLLGEERQQRRHQPDQRGEHRVERVVGVGLVAGDVAVGVGARRPEALAGAADVPVVQRVEEGD